MLCAQSRTCVAPEALGGWQSAHEAAATSLCSVVQAAGNMYGVLFYSLILTLLASSGQCGKMVARLPLFWSQSHQRSFFPGAQRRCADAFS